MMIPMLGEPRGALTGRSPKHAVLAYSGQFTMLLLTVLRSHGDSNFRGTPGCAYGEFTKTRSFDLFWPVFDAITHSFGVPRRFERSGNPGLRLRGGHQNSQF